MSRPFAVVVVVLLVAALAAACGGVPSSEPLTPSSPARDDGEPVVVAGGGGQIVLRIEFDPPLAAPARLQIEHESGLRTTVTTTRTWAAVRLPPGPVTLKLAERGERVLRLSTDEPTLTIEW